MLNIISKEEFKILKREPLLDYDLYNAESTDLLSRIPNAAKRLGDSGWLTGKTMGALIRLTRARSDYALDLLTLSYSAGLKLEELREFYISTLEYFEEYGLYVEAFNKQRKTTEPEIPLFYLKDVEFDRANRLLCFAILLGWQQFIPRIMRLIDYKNMQKDGMLERLVATYVPTRGEVPVECTRHLPYFKTLPVFSAPVTERPRFMREYLTDWYAASRREPYFESHTRSGEFRGYWSWEAAAITVALRMDDSSYRELEFYPRDLAAFAMASGSQELGRPESADVSDIRAKAGEPCLVSGQWESLGTPVQRRHYERDMPMADLGSPYGLTVWRFLPNS
nr:PoNe immunity protein domain-containing protein [uncultured Massilia sp.]